MVEARKAMLFTKTRIYIGDYNMRICQNAVPSELDYVMAKKRDKIAFVHFTTLI